MVTALHSFKALRCIQGEKYAAGGEAKHAMVAGFRLKIAGHSGECLTILETMHTRRFFIAATLAPLLFLICAIAVFFAASEDVWVNIMVMLLIPYAIFAGLMVLAATKLSVKAVRRLSYRAPVILLLVQYGYILLTFWLGYSIAHDAVGLAGILIFVSINYIIVGYLYVFIMEQGFISYLFQRRSGSGCDLSANANHEKNRLVC